MVDLPSTTGNGLVEMAGRTITIDRDLRGSVGDRWYWHVRVAGGGAVRLRLARPGLVGGFGPAVLWPDGQDFGWIRSTYRVEKTFEIDLGPDPRPVHLAATRPYGLARFWDFIEELRPEPLRIFRLGRTEGDLPVLAVHLPARAAARHRVLVAARHHACEAVGSMVLEAIVAAFVEFRRHGVRWSLDTEFIAIPFVDVDGVIRGDQGKGRLPHDHNRDYGPVSRYSSVRAIRSADLIGDLPTVALDLHTPGLAGPLEERPFLVASGDRGDVQVVRDFAEAVAGGDTARPEVMVFGEPWNSASTAGPRSFVAWARSHRNVLLGASVEYPNAVVRGVPVSRDDVSHFGRRLVAALGQVFE